jgi:hypothetical protein
LPFQRERAAGIIPIISRPAGDHFVIRHIRGCRIISFISGERTGAASAGERIIGCIFGGASSIIRAIQPGSSKPAACSQRDAGNRDGCGDSRRNDRSAPAPQHR